MANRSEILVRTSKGQAVAIEALKLVPAIEIMSDDWVEWAASFIKENQCFSNSLNASIIMSWDYVLGYVFIPSYGITIEHAWNAEAEKHFDLTAQLLWEKEKDEEAYYIQLFRFTANDAMSIYERFGGVDQMALRRAPDFRGAFRKSPDE